MKKGLILAAMIILAAAAAGCAIREAFPGLLLPTPPKSGSPAGTDALATKPPSTVPPTAAPTPPPAPTPKPAPKPYDAVKRYSGAYPQGLTVDLQYDRYFTPVSYFVALKSGKVYAKATTDSKKLLSFSTGARYRADKTVLGADGKSRWYHVLWSDKSGKHEGYVKESAGSARSFRLDEMLRRVQALEATTDMDGTVFVTNYKNRLGLPPKLPGGKEQDEFGNRRSQSAPAYTKPDAKSPFRYAPDGLLGRKLEVSDNYTKVYFPSFNEERWVPSKYLSKQDDAISTLKQTVVVDRKNQNAAVFERDGEGWKLIAMTYVSTGKTGKYSVKTPLGDFMAQDRASRFYYYADGTKIIDGYAPWAVRFSGGGYLHGVPRTSTYDENGVRYDPPAGESLRTLGTTPQSHMCVRNYTSFAKFVYDWYAKGSCAVIVME